MHTGRVRADPIPLPEDVAVDCAERYACLADPVRVRLLHAVAAGPATVDELAELVGVSQDTCAHHVRTLADNGFVEVDAAVVTGTARRAGLPHPAETVLGLLAVPDRSDDVPGDVVVRALREEDWPAVRRTYGEGIATGNATFETEVPPREVLEATWLADHRWVAEVDGAVAGWAAATPVSARECYAGVVETSLYVGADVRGRGVGKALLRRQVAAADAGGLWTLQTSIFPENRASLLLHRAAGFRVVGVRERIGRHHGAWRDTVLLERRRP
ncbi:hypothetical protein GCM10023108_40600 [Saccharopolyspora hordei]